MIWLYKWEVYYMILTKCKKEHYYDSDKFAECPYCALEKCGVTEKMDDWAKNAFEETQTVIGRYENTKGS